MAKQNHNIFLKNIPMSNARPGWRWLSEKHFRQELFRSPIEQNSRHRAGKKRKKPGNTLPKIFTICQKTRIFFL